MNKMRRGGLNLPTEDLEAEMFDYIIQELENNGFEHYKISKLYQTWDGESSQSHVLEQMIWCWCWSPGLCQWCSLSQ